MSNTDTINVGETVTNAILSFIFFFLLLFIGLQVTDFIDWNWWMVLSPIWMPLMILLLVGGIKCIYYMFNQSPQKIEEENS